MAVAAEKLSVVQDQAQLDRPPRFVTATSLFDGHDAAINVMRRILQSSGAEIIHLGHNRSVREVVSAAVHEDADGIAVSSYQGGHIEYFKYILEMLEQYGRSDIRVFGGGGGVIVPHEIDQLHECGVARIFSPADGQEIGLQGIIDEMLAICHAKPRAKIQNSVVGARDDNFVQLGLLISGIEAGSQKSIDLIEPKSRCKQAAPILGITGTGGSGKSSLTDELVHRIRIHGEGDLRVAILAVDPTRKKTGGALLGDRIRLNASDSNQVFVRSIATRDGTSGIPTSLNAIIDACRIWDFDLIVVETPGIGQGDTAIVPYVDRTIYVMTPEYGAASQLEKIDMLDYADLVAINKFDAKGAEDAYRDVCKQVQRNRGAFGQDSTTMPVFGTISARFNDDGVTALFAAIAELLELRVQPGICSVENLPKTASNRTGVIPSERIAYLAEIAATSRAYRAHVEAQALLAREIQHLHSVVEMLEKSGDRPAIEALAEQLQTRERRVDGAAQELLLNWPARAMTYRADTGGESDSQSRYTTTISGTRVPKISLPQYADHGDLLRWLMLENLPGSYPYTGGVFPYKRDDEDPTRMFAGEGGPAKTNRRFKLLSAHSAAKRLSTAFDSVSLYGFDPDERPDIYGKVGNSGVSIATLEDMKVLYGGFDLCSPNTSVSMTINGPAPTYLAMLLNTAVDQQIDAFVSDQHRQPDPDEAREIKATALRQVRGTVQADILKEDQGQNTCIFSTEFSLRLMGDIQAYFIENDVRNFYSVSISGYHIAEAGANPISQLAFTLANAFTYVEMYLARGMHIDDFASNLSFFFSNGLDAEYTVMGRVARRIWAIALKERYGASAKSQRLKYHIQTSGRSLHAQEIDFNDIRTTLQALIAVYDNCNSLHTNAFDEAITTPTEASVRRAMAIQLIINKEWGLARSDNPNQGSFVLEELTDLVEEAVLCEFEAISRRGGVLGAMETGYQRACIQDQSLHYEHLKHSGKLPIVGVNMFLDSQSPAETMIEQARSTDAEKQSQLDRLRAFHATHQADAPAALELLQQTALEGGNVFAALMLAVRCCSVGQITAALFAVGGKYRRNM